MLALVALVDDDISVRRALTRLLKSAGLRVRACASAVEFFEVVWPKAPDCLVLDIHLGAVSGLELLASLRSAGQDLPTVIITAHVDLQNRELAAKFGCTAYLLKPLDPQIFLNEVFRALNREVPSR